MTSVELEVDEQSYVGSVFMAHVAKEIRRALIAEKAERKITQQAIAEKIGTSRAVVNREISGVENMSARRIAELLWAIGWEPHFEARKPPGVPATNYANENSFALPLAKSVGEPTISVRIGAGAA